MKLPDALRITGALTRIRALNYSQQHRKDLPQGTLDPQVASFLVILQSQRNSRPLVNKTPTEARADFWLNMVLYRKFSGPIAPVPNVWNASIEGPHGSIPLRFYMPAGSGPFPLMVYFHGGGWVLGNLNTSDNVARTLCHFGRMSVISVDYRLAPENKFPIPLDDCYAVYQWAARHANAAQLRGDPDRLVLCGDSAGGNLCAAVCLKARDEGGPSIAQQVLFYPALDLASLDSASYRKFQNFPLLSREDMHWYIGHYLNNSAEALQPYASPNRAADLTGLPPATVITAEFDVLEQEGSDYAHALQAAGVDVLSLQAKALPHAFLSLREITKRAQHFTQLCMDHLNERLK